MSEKNLCSYGCGRESIVEFRNGKFCCEKSRNQCPSQKELNRIGNTGRIHPEETKKKIGNSNRNKKRAKPFPIKNEEKILCSYGCGNIATHQYPGGKLCCVDSQYRCPEQRRKNKERLDIQFKDPKRVEKQRMASLKSWKDPDRKNKNTIGLKRFYENETEDEKIKRLQKNQEAHKSKSHREKMSLRAKEFWKREKYIKNHKISMKKLNEDPLYHKKLSKGLKKFHKENPNYLSGNKNGMYGKKHKLKSKEIMKEKGKIRWLNPEFTKKFFIAINLKPNKPETLLINLFKDLKLEYNYTGNFSFWINGKNPDFINYNNNELNDINKLIEKIKSFDQET